VTDPPAAAQPSPAAYLRLVLLGAAIGIPAALLAAVFLAFVHDLEHWLWTDLPDALGYSSPPWFLVIGLPVVGAAVVLAARRLLPGDGGSSPLLGIAGHEIRLSHAPGVALAAVGTLAFGAVLGPEAPLIALGSAVGLVAVKLARIGEREGKVLSLAGSFSAISSLFGGPIVGGVMMTEASSGLGAAATPVLVPGFVAAATGYLIFVGLGDWGGLAQQPIAVPGLPPYHGTHVRDLLVGVVVGVAAAIAVVAVRRVATALAARGGTRLGMPALLLGGGLAVGLTAQVAGWLGAGTQDVLFSGQQSVPLEVALTSAETLLVLVVAKAIAYAISLGCGFRGGPVFPAIFLGVGLAAFAVIWLDLSPTAAVAVGAAAGMAAMTRLLLTSILFGALLVGANGLDAIPAAVVAAVAAWLTVTALDRRAADETAPATAAHPASAA
jgi:H+/Cl- antiporter ClcA